MCVFLPIYLSIYLCLFCKYIWMCDCRSIYLSLSVHIYLSLFMWINLPVHNLSIYSSDIYLSIYLASFSSWGLLKSSAGTESSIHLFSQSYIKYGFRLTENVYHDYLVVNLALAQNQKVLSFLTSSARFHPLEIHCTKIYSKLFSPYWLFLLFKQWQYPIKSVVHVMVSLWFLKKEKMSLKPLVNGKTHSISLLNLFSIKCQIHCSYLETTKD